jgi:hypothetical protein
MDLITSLLSGGAIVIVIAKWALSRSFEQFDEMLASIQAIEMRLAATDVHIKEGSELRRLVHEHDREIASLKSNVRALYGERIYETN